MKTRVEKMQKTLGPKPRHTRLKLEQTSFFDLAPALFLEVFK